MSDLEPRVPVTPSPVGGGSATEEIEELEKRFHYKQELKRGLSLVELTAYGVNWMGPLAPALIFGLLLVQSGGTVALPYAIAGVAMVFTAASYVVMVPNFPLAGSAYNYVSKGWNPYLGFLTGWVMVIDYLLFPAIAAIGGGYYVQQVFPFIPFWVIILGFAIYTAILNLLGVELMAKLGLWLLVASEIVVASSFIIWSWAAGANGAGFGTALTLDAFQFESFPALMGAASLAVLSYLGFDAVSTLSEEANHPKRDIPRAIYFAVFIGGGTMVATGYFGILPIGPEWPVLAEQPGWIEAALYHASVIAAGPWYGAFYTAGFVLVIAVFNVVATAAAARLLYGMGRDDLLPRPIFGAINQRFRTPHFNVLIVVALILIIAFLLDVNTIANLINFGALLGFATLNLAVIWLYVVKKEGVELKITRRTPFLYYLRFLIVPLAGFLVVGYVFLNLDPFTLMVGTIWLGIGIVYLAARTSGFRKLPPILEV